MAMLTNEYIATYPVWPIPLNIPAWVKEKLSGKLTNATNNIIPEANSSSCPSNAYMESTGTRKTIHKTHAIDAVSKLSHFTTWQIFFSFFPPVAPMSFPHCINPAFPIPCEKL